MKPHGPRTAAMNLSSSADDPSVAEPDNRLRPYNYGSVGETMQPEELAELIAAGAPPIIIDVRSEAEFRAGHIPGALHVPAWRILLQGVPLPANKNTRLVVTCEHGQRAQLAKGLLFALGYRHVTLLDGHMAEWRISGKHLEK